MVPTEDANSMLSMVLQLHSIALHTYKHPPNHMTPAPLAMATLDYAEIPSYATRLQSADPSHHTIRSAPKILTALPNPDNIPHTRHSPTTDGNQAAAASAGPSSPFSMTIPTLLLSTAFQFPDAGGSAISNPTITTTATTATAPCHLLAALQRRTHAEYTITHPSRS